MTSSSERPPVDAVTVPEVPVADVPVTDATVTDVAIIGAGPAGLAAAVTAADAGLAVTLLDIGERIGGQYFRHAADQAASDEGSPLHHDWGTFVALRERFDRHVASGRVSYRARHAVWSVRPGRPFATVRAIEGERERLARVLRARAVIVATGAHDRHVPFPGWELPGVMAAGGAQALLKGSGVAPGRRAVVAGTGPLLFPVADALLGAGVEVAEVVEANAPWRLLSRLGALPGGAAKLPEIAGYAWRLGRSRVPYRTRRAVIAAHGGDRLEAVTVARVRPDWTVAAGSERTVQCDLLAVGYGFTAQVELALGAGCAHALGRDGSLVIAADPDGRTSAPGIYAAGETTGIGGCDLALLEGRLCGAAIVADLGLRPVRGRRSAQGRRARAGLLLRRAALREFAAALHEAYPVKDGWITWLHEDTLVCRCEEVRYASVRAALTELGAGDLRTVKLLARPGMGWCQGRICGSAVAELVAHHRGRPVSADDLLAASKRTLAMPVPLGELAGMDMDVEAPDVGVPGAGPPTAQAPAVQRHGGSQR